MSTLKVNSLQPANAGSEDYFLARAWVNFNGTGTVAIRADGNVSSITDNGTGNYTTNFSTSFVDANYATTHGTGGSNTYDVTEFRIGDLTRNAYTASSVQCVAPNNANTAEIDRERVMLSMTR